MKEGLGLGYSSGEVGGGIAARARAPVLDHLADVAVSRREARARSYRGWV